MKIRIKIARTAEQATSAEMVASIDDLLKQILLGLPIKSLIRFKSVSKHWLSLISNPRFAVLRRHNPTPTGMFLRNTIHGKDPRFHFVNFDICNPIAPPFSVLEFNTSTTGVVTILQSCNGLFLCSSPQAQRPRKKFHVFNPTTKQSAMIPNPCRMTIHGVALSFDPAKSQAYKVVCIRDSNLVPGLYQIEIYSSENGDWRVSGKPFKANHDFKNGVYCNGAIHWLCNWRYDNFLYFNVDEERLGEMPPLYTSEYLSGDLTYFGESHGHLHFIEMYGRPDMMIEINEMRRDYSGWFVKYNVNLSAVGRAFPATVRSEIGPWRNAYDSYSVSILAVIRGEEEEDAFVVLQIPGKAIRCNLVAQTFHKLCDFAEAENGGGLRFDDFCGHQFFESLSCV